MTNGFNTLRNILAFSKVNPKYTFMNPSSNSLSQAEESLLEPSQKPLIFSLKVFVAETYFSTLYKDKRIYKV